MKKFLLVLIGALLSAGAVYADAKVVLPGFPNEKSHKESKINTKRNAFGVSKIRPVNAPVKMVVDPQDMVVKSMLTSYKKTTHFPDYPSDNIEAVSFTYDEYGFPKTETDNYGFVSTFEYQWRVPGRIWSSRTVTVNGEKHITSRTFHPNGMVATQTQGDTFTRFDENGYLIEITTETEYNYESHKYVYFKPNNSWYESTYFNDNKTEVTIDGNSVTRTEMMKMSDGKWYYIRMYTDYYDTDGNSTGYLSKQYNVKEGEANNVIMAGGTRSVNYTENGKLISKTEEYDEDLDDWECSIMTIQSENYKDPYIYKAGEVRFYEYYYDINGDGIVDSDDIQNKEVITWVKERILKTEYTYYGEDMQETEISYALASEDGKELDDIYYNTSNGSYCVNKWEDDTDYYTYYDANHNVLESFRAIENENAPETWEKKIGNTWEKCTGTITIDDGNNDRYIISFDDKNRIIRIEEWESGLLDEYCTYAYDADGNGWVRTDYTMQRIDGSQTAQTIKIGEYGYRTLANGSTEKWEIDFNAPSNPYSSWKNITQSNGAIQKYIYENGEWIFNGWAVQNKETLLADGSTEIIEYEIDGRGNVSNFRKEIRKDIYEEDYEYNYYQVYNWDEQNSKWVGAQFEINTRHINLDSTYETFSWSNSDDKWYPESKRIEAHSYFPDIEYIEPVNPLAANDEYFFETEKYPVSTRIMTVFKMYEWDAESQKMILREAYGEEYKKISDKEVEITDYNDFRNSGVKTSSFKVDDLRRVIEYKGNTWTYNDKNQVTGRVFVDSFEQFSEVYEFTYTDIKVWSGFDEIVGHDATVIATYNLAGLAVDADNLPAGVYIQKLSNGASRKIVVK